MIRNLHSLKSGLVHNILFVCLIFSFMIGRTMSQNIVPNHSFENYTSLPSYYGEWFKCTDWSNVNGFAGFMWPYGSPDYMHTSGSGGVDLPVCTFGTIDPHEGEAILGFITYLDYEPNFREYISAQFTEPMVTGNTYTISFWLANGDSPMNGLGTDHVGVQFSDGPLVQLDHEPIGGLPQIELPGIVFSNDWVYYEFTYIADAAYDHITIGNFYDDANTSNAEFDPMGIGGSYYFIDEVTVLPSDLLAVTVDTTICEGTVYELPDGSFTAISGTYIDTIPSVSGADSIITTNLFVAPVYAITVDASICEGSLYALPDGTFTGDAGTYITTFMSSYECDSIITTNLTVAPFLTSFVDAAICEGDTYTLPDGAIITDAGVYNTTLVSTGGCDSIVTTTLTVSLPSETTENILICSGSSYSLPDNTEVFSAGIYTTHLISIAGCDSTIITNLTVTDVFTVTVDTSILEGQVLVLPDGNIAVEAGVYVFDLISSGGCDSIVTINLAIIPNNFDVDVPNAFSPNNDGTNDVFHILQNSAIILSFTVYNRWGQPVYETGSGLVAWDGRSNGIEQEVGMYVYVLKYIVGQEERTHTGTIILIR